MTPKPHEAQEMQYAENEIAQVYVSRSLLVLGGAGAVASCTVPLIFRELEFEKVTLLDIKRPEYIPKGAVFVASKVTVDNYQDILGQYLKADDICLNLSVLDSAALFAWCMENDVMYLDTSSESWAETKSTSLDNRMNFREASLSRLHRQRDAVLADLYRKFPEKKEWATTVVQHGMNPGLVNQFIKQGLVDIATTLLEREEGCRNRKEIEKHLYIRAWNRLAQALGVKTIHISERDTQRSIKPRSPGEFHCTWSIDAFLVELKDYAEIGIGTHEKRIPREAYVFEDKDDTSAILGGKAMNMRMHSWVPSGSFHGFPCPHDESITMAHFLEVRSDKDELEYRPTVSFVYLPCDASVASIHEFGMNGYREPPTKVLLRDDTIIAGEDEVGVLLLGHELGAWWTGSRLDIYRAKSILPGHNATTLQVAAGVIGALTWMMQNPKAGFNLPEHINHEVVIQAAKPYLEPYMSIQSDWSPLQNLTPHSICDYGDRFGPMENGANAPCVPKKEDEWQLATMLMQPSGNVWVPNPCHVETKTFEFCQKWVGKNECQYGSSGENLLQLIQSQSDKMTAFDEKKDEDCSTLMSPWKENSIQIIPTGHPMNDSRYDMTIVQRVPEGIRIGQTSYGWGLFAEREFMKGEVIYQGHAVVIPNRGSRFLLRTNQNDFELDTFTHSCQIGQTDSRFLYGFDGFFNHSCNSNSYSRDHGANEKEVTYFQVASRDIQVGQEITCDYDLFEWDCRDKGIDICLCGSSNCRGTVHGFKFWPKEQQIARLGQVSCDGVLQSWLQANPNTVYHVFRECPSGIRLTKSSIDGHWGLTATSPFSKGETIFKNQAVLFSQPNPEKGQRDTLVVSCPDPNWFLNMDQNQDQSYELGNGVVRTSKGKYMFIEAPLVSRSLDWLYYTEIRSRDSEQWVHEFFSFDTFCNHGCSPSGEMVYSVDQQQESIENIGPVICSMMPDGRWTIIKSYGDGGEIFGDLADLSAATRDNVILLGPGAASKIKGVESYRMVACNSIASGDEITCDYSDLLGPDVGFVIENCQCGSPQCRGRIIC